MFSTSSSKSWAKDAIKVNIQTNEDTIEFNEKCEKIFVDLNN